MDRYIEVHRLKGTLTRRAVPIARRLYDAGRYEEALGYLDKAGGFCHPNDEDGTLLKSQVYEALGRTDEAVKVLWAGFGKQPSTITLDEILRLSSPDRHEAIREEACRIAVIHRDIYGALRFLVQQKQLKRVADLVEQRQNELSGKAYDCLLPVAETLQQSYPAEAWIVYKILVADVPESSRYKVYDHAACYAQRMNVLLKQAGMEEKQAEWLEGLRQHHGRKRSFWEKLQGLNTEKA